MKSVALLGLVAGLAIGMALVSYFGFAAVGNALLAIGGIGFLLIVVLHLAIIALLGLCWQLLAPPDCPARPFLWARLVRDSGSEVLPLSQLGGIVMGMRAAMLLGVTGALAIGSMIVDATLELLAQIAYAAIGLAILLWLHAGLEMALWVGLGLLGAVALALVFICLQRRGFGAIEHAAARLTRRLGFAALVETRSIHAEILSIYRRPRALTLAFLLHLAVWILSGIEAWLALRLMGASIGLASVLAIESLLYAIRSAAFAVPNAIGVQEATLVMLGAALGLPPETALALSLLKRARDIVIGVPALACWQLMETGRLWQKRPPLGAATVDVGTPQGS
jgi:putative membrane protein